MSDLLKEVEFENPKIKRIDGQIMFIKYANIIDDKLADVIADILKCEMDSKLQTKENENNRVYYQYAKTVMTKNEGLYITDGCCEIGCEKIKVEHLLKFYDNDKS
jgi:hypothetical protein